MILRLDETGTPPSGKKGEATAPKSEDRRKEKCKTRVS